MTSVHYYGIRNILRDSLPIAVFLIILVAVCLALTGHTLDKWKESSKKAESFEKNYGGKNWYWTAEALNDRDFYSYLEGDDGSQQRKIGNVRRMLEAEKKFMFFTCNNHPISLLDKVNDMFLKGYESGDHESSKITENRHKKYVVKALMVSKNYFLSGKVKIKKGRQFQSKDYAYIKNKPVPVLLGNAYMKHHKIGDKIEAEYLFEKMTLEVIGFMDSSTFYLSSADGDFVSTERYIILPAIHVVGRNDWFSKNVMLNGLYGTIETKTGFEETVQICKSIMEKQGLFWNLNIQDPETGQGVFSVRKYSKLTNQAKKQFGILAILSLVFSVVAMVISIFNILRNNLYLFGVELLCGASYKSIFTEGIGFTVLITLAGDMIGCVILAITGCGIKSLLTVQVVAAGVSAITGVSVYFYIRNMEIGEIIGGKE